MVSISQLTNYSPNANGSIGSSPYYDPRSNAVQKHQKQPIERKSVISSITDDKFFNPSPATYPREMFEGVPNLNPLENPNVHSTNIVDYTLETIIKSKFASVSPNYLPEIKSYVSKMQTLNNYNPINLLLMLKKTNNYLQDVVQDRKGIVTEIKYFLDEEDEKLDGISINIYLPVKEAKELSDIWDYLNENIDSEENGAERIFFNVRKKM